MRTENTTEHDHLATLTAERRVELEANCRRAYGLTLAQLRARAEAAAPTDNLEAIFARGH